MPGHRRSAKRRSGPRRRPGGKLELVIVVASTVFFALAIQAFAVKPYVIPSPSMLPTLKPGQRVLVDRFSHTLGSSPKVGDITVFHPPSGAETSLGGKCGTSGEGPSYFRGARVRRSCARPTSSPSRTTTYIKRVVGLPGDRIEIRAGHVVRNGRPASEPFARSCAIPVCNLDEIVIAPGSYFLMGDNRANSNDSRYWGPVPRAWIIGKAVATYWPPDRIGAP